jgi:DNA-binding PadR family transcriptional regulator
MFGRRFAYQHHGGDWEGGAPPWLRHEHRHHHGPCGPFRFFGMRMKRGFFGPGGPFGPEGPFGPGGEGRRFFGRGDLKFALLELLQERPMHGYEMMRALEEKSGGFYVPSAGSIYPTLQMLEDRGLVTVAESEGKKVYSITDAGKNLLAERQKEESQFAGGPFWERSFGPGSRWGAPEMQALRTEAAEVARLAAIAGRMAYHDPTQLQRFRGILERARKELSEMIYGSASTEGPDNTTTTP